jgi:hypothetical protein
LRSRGVTIPEEGSSRHLLEDLLDDLAFAKGYVDRVSLSLLQGILKPLQMSTVSSNLAILADRLAATLEDIEEILVELQERTGNSGMPAGLERDLGRLKRG